ncbi:hypothetical protein H9P43_007668 [Blastocladiella emersonii ATCC 22665]|nr:hypothetical protein H9P43_007668 [Blastocladiella emersonii ATCC 22665]
MSASSSNRGRRPRLLAVLVAALVASLLLAAAPSPAAAQQAVEPQCVQVDTAGTLCSSMGSKLVVARNVSEFLGQYVPIGVAMSSLANVRSTIASSADFKALIDHAFSVTGFSAFSSRLFNCTPVALTGRWYKAMTCSAIALHGAASCNVKAQERVLCPKEQNEFWATFDQAISHAANKCFNVTFSKTRMNAARNASKLLMAAKPNNCMTGEAIEGAASCGFPTLTQACAHSCSEPSFIASQNGAAAAVCKAELAKNPTVPVVEFLTGASVSSTTGNSDGSRDPSTATGSPSGSPSGSAAAPSASPSGGVDSASANASQGFMDRKLAGVPGKFWLFGGGGVLAVVAVIGGLVVMRRGSRRKSKAFVANGSMPRDHPEAAGDRGMGSAASGPRNLPEKASPHLTLQSLPNGSPRDMGGPRSPADEFGNNYYSLARGQVQQQQPPMQMQSSSPHMSPPSGPGGPSPPPPAWGPPPSGNGYDAYGNEKGYHGHPDSYAMAPMPPAGGPGARPESVAWNAVAKRASTRPPSMAPRDGRPRPRQVVLSYIPRLDDELEVHVGDAVAVFEEYGDGYAWGEAWDGRQGVFPIMCLADPNAPPAPAPPMPAAAIGAPAGPGGPPPGMQEGGVRETMINPQAYRFTQYTVASDMSDDDDYPPHPQQHQQGRPLQQGPPQGQYYGQQQQQSQQQKQGRPW